MGTAWFHFNKLGKSRENTVRSVELSSFVLFCSPFFFFIFVALGVS